MCVVRQEGGDVLINRQLYTMKFMSSRLKKFDYNINIDYNQALENGEIVALSDSQMLRTIRKVVFEKTKDDSRLLNRELLEEFYSELNRIRKRKNSDDNKKIIKKYKDKIIKMCYIPEYITIVIEHPKHYDDMYYKGLIINGVNYYRISVSAGQGRASTVTFCSGDILEAVNTLLDNGRNKEVKFSPSKFNAYKGTYCSASKEVTTPRFCVVPDYESNDTFDVNWVTETDFNKDDTIEIKNITKSFNRWDGMGLISPRMAEIWSKDLDLDYTPSQFCIRQSFVKGLLNVFPFHEFCEKKNNGNYIVKSIYKNKNGEDIFIDLNEYDVILTESQFKLWNSYSSLEEYTENCKNNDLKWGVSLYTDKEIKNTLKMNYQFLQVNNIAESDIPKLCEEFVDWIKGVNITDENNIYYTLLFLLGKDVTKSMIENYLKNSNNYWVKSLIVNHDLINDKYIKYKIYNLIKTKIDSGCLGSIVVRGNYQPLVSDPYGMMEYLCGLPVNGLISKNRYYSYYWNNKNVKNIIGMRAPLTYRSEILPMELEDTKEQQYWYRYNQGGIIVNIHGHETDNWAGSDFN